MTTRSPRASKLLMALLFAAAAACSEKGAAEPKQGGGGPKGPGGGGPTLVRVATAVQESVPRIIEITGTLLGDEEVTVSAEVEGRVERVAADLGDEVKQHSPLVVLAQAELALRAEQAEAEYLQALAKLGVESGQLDRYQPDQHANVKKAEADLENAKQNLSRGEEMMRRGMSAQGEIDLLRTRARVAEAAQQVALEESRSAYATALARRAAARLARKKRDDTTIHSPINGRVARRMVSVGEYVKAGQAVAVVVGIDPLKLRGDVPERYAGAVEAGMPIEIRVEALGGKREGKVSRVGPAIAASSRTFPVEALLANADRKLRPGLFAHAEIRIGENEDVFAVPEVAVASTAGVVKVYVEDGGKARERRVQVLRKRGGDALVAGELKHGERVIVTAIARLYEGADVQIDAGGGGDARHPNDATGATGATGNGSPGSPSAQPPKGAP